MGALEQLAAELLGQQAQQQIAAENPYYQFSAVPQAFTAGALNAQTTGKNPRQEMWSRSLAASLGGLIGGGLQGLGNDYQNVLSDRYYKALTGAAEPTGEGLSPGLFGAVKRGRGLFAGVRDAGNLEREDALNLEFDAKRKMLLLEKPWLAQMFGSSGNGEAMPPRETEPPLNRALQTGKSSTKDRYNQIYQENLMAGQPPTQAAVAAREMLKGEIKANTGSVDQAAKAREYAQGLLELADRAESGIDAAGETGPGDTVRGAQLWTQSLFGGPESTQRLTGRQLLDSIKSDLVKMKRSPGAVSDYENRMILAGGPTTDKTKEANAALLTNWRELARYNQEYADFLDAYREINGTIAGAETLWNQYRQAYPLYKETIGEGGVQGEISAERMPWQEFFVRLANGEPPKAPESKASQSVPSLGSTFNGQKVVKIEKVK